MSPLRTLRHWQSHWAVALSLSLLLAGCSGGRESRHAPSAEARHAQVAPTADVPALVGVSIDALHQRLGASRPVAAKVAAAMPEKLLNLADSVAAFRTGGLTLIASYNARSRQVRDLLLLGHHEDSLMGRARLRSNDPNYLVMPVFYADNSYRLLGLRVLSTN